ncbi:MAG: GNAT family N-acetyltransferase [Gudongella sp.]|jgi:predicted GNAT superfamily acetyltransferase|nr:GNAT family N-acetyltransferase [Gudongella sp.]
MENVIIRKFETEDSDRLLELNHESVHFLSPLTKEKLNSLILQSETLNVIEVDGVVEAFVMTLREGKEYDSVNYLWFSNNYDHFLYVDRVVVSLKMHGKGLGNMLYNSVFSHAKLVGVPYVAAEIDISPPNPGSLRFHEKFGFKEVGKQTVADGKKVVSLQVVTLV